MSFWHYNKNTTFFAMRILAIIALLVCFSVQAADTKKPKKPTVDAELKQLTKGLKSEYDKFNKTTVYRLANSMSSAPRRLTLELTNPDEGDAVLRLKAWLTIVRPNTPIRTQKLLVMAGDDVLELACTDGNYRFVEGRASNFNITLSALAGESASRPPDREEIDETEANKEAAAIIQRISETEKGQKVEIRFAGQQNKSDFKMEDRDRALFAPMVALRDYLNAQKVKEEK